MDNTTKLRVMFDMVDNMTKPLQMMLTGNKGLAAALKDTRRELAELGTTQKRIGEFREMRKGLANTASDLSAARARVDTLAQSLRATRSPSQQMISDFNKAQRAAENLASAHHYQAGRVQAMRTQLAGAGIDTHNLSRDERKLRADMASRTSMMNAGVSGFDARRRKRVEAVRNAVPKLVERGQALKEAGTKVLEAARGPVDEAKHAESAALRLRMTGASTDTVQYVRALNVRGRSTTDNLDLMYEIQKELHDEQLAKVALPTMSKISFSNAALFSEEDAKAHDEKLRNMLKVINLRDGMKSETAFLDEADAIQKMQTGTDSKVSGDEWNDFAEAGGNAAKQLRKNAFYFQMEPVIQTLGGKDAGKGLASLYDSVLQGKLSNGTAREMKALGLIDPKQAGKGNALLGSDLLKSSPVEWLEKVLLPKLTAKGITRPDDVKATITRAFPNQDAGKLLTTIFDQREQIHTAERNSIAAPGIDATQSMALQSTQGHELAAQARLRDLKREIGEKITPTYNTALDYTATATEKVVGLLQEHGTAAGIVAAAYVGLKGLLPVAGALASSMGTALESTTVSRIASMGAGALESVGATLSRFIPLALSRLAPVALGNPWTAAALGVGTVVAGAGTYLWKNPEAFGGAGAWMKEKLGTHDPAPSATGAPSSMTRTAAALTTTAALVGPPAFAASPAIAAAAPLERYNMSLDYRAPLTAPAAAAASAAPAAGPVTINIAPPPGADAAEIARMVRAELERTERAKASRTGSRLSD
ncbi:hypothetical protein [Burkholderia lata]|uniref:hypothetical protein n=1 Tax=Burkholderia lata (strain ATCC 17760 / DSM 23089 / LMG 22485 / NCIMB 9086 / R18194 / 383) TaxID=482957 RepID=UPI001453EAFB|nr:hypothetical protein [Burkholderia lata]VWB86193.1 membrane protein [Burkholderia lata]